MEVLTQNNINEIIKSNIAATEYIVNAVSASITKIANNKNIKDIKDNIKSFKNVCGFVTKYSELSKLIIDSFSNNLPDSKGLNEILGRIEEDDPDKKGAKITKYTIVDSIHQISIIINDIVSTVDTLSKFDIGFKAFIKIKLNIMLLKSMITDLLKDLVSSFANIGSEKDLEFIINSFVKQPDTTITEIDNNINKTGENTIDTTKTKTVLEGGKLGLLDVFTQTFSLMNVIANLKIPAMFILKKRINKTIKTLKTITDSLIDFAITNAGDAQLKQIEQLSILLAGDGDKGVNKGIINIISRLNMLFITIKNLKFSFVQFLKVEIAIYLLKEIISDIVQLVNNDELNILNDKDFTKRLTQITDNIDKLSNIFIAMSKASIYSIVFLIGVIPLSISLVLLKGLFIELSWVIKSVDKIDSNNLDNILDIVESLQKIMLKLSFMTLLSITGIVGIISAIIFTVGLGIFVLAIWGISTLISKIADFAVENLKKVNKLIFSLMLIGAAILLFAIIAPVIEKALRENILGFLIVLFGSIVLLAAMLWVAKILSDVASKAAIGLAVNILIIAGCFILAAMTILVAGLVGQQMKDGDSIINILIGLAGIIVVSGVMVGLGIALSFAAPFIGMASIGITPLVAVLALMLAAGLTLVALGHIKLEFGNYDKETDTGDGIKGNVGKIINFTKFLREQLKSYTKDDKKAIKRGKKLIKQVKKTVNQIKEIADSLNYIQNITLDSKKILENTSSIFTFIKELDSHIDKMLYGENATTKDKVISTITDFSVVGFIKRRIDRRKAKNVNKKLNKVEKVITTLRDIGDSLISINDLKINDISDQITKNVEAIFGFVAQLDSKIATLLNSEKQTTDENNNVVTVALSPKELRKQARQERKNLKRANKKLNKVEKVITTLNNVGTAVSSIQEFKLTSQLRTEIESNVSELFLFISSLDGEIVKFMAKTETNEDENIIDTEKMSKREWKKANKKLSKVEKVIATIQSIGDALTTIKELGFGKDKDKDGNDKLKTEIIANVKGSFDVINDIATAINGKTDIINIDNTKLNNATKLIDYIQSLNNGFKSIGDVLNTIKELGFGKDKDKDGNDKLKTTIINNVNSALSTIDEIATSINGKSDTINIDETKLNNATKLINYIQSLNNCFKGISESDSNKIKSNLDNYVKFVEKANTIDVAKVETTSNLFKQMSKFSNSIKGDFDKLAESLSEKLLPVLTELKEIMSEVPDKLEVGFRNTSASIGAANAAPTRENVAAQVSRENPNLSKSDVDTIVTSRLNEKAKIEANGMSAKLDELISLLKGMSGETVVVKTV